MREMKAGSTSKKIYLEVLDSTSTTGGRKTGLAFNTSSLTAYYTINGAAAVSISLVTQTVTGAFSSGGFVEVSSANAPGLYRLDIPDAAIASGESVVVTLKGATGMVQVSEEIMLVPWDPQDAVRMGLTALPNANAEAAGGLFTRGSGAGQINQQANGQIDSNVARWLNTAVTAAQAGIPDVALKAILGTTLTETAGQIAGAFKQFFNIASPTSTVNLLTAVTTLTTYTGNTPQTGDSFARIGAAGASLSAIPDEAGVTTLLARLTATRAGYLDNLSAGAVAQASALASLVTTVGVAGAGLTAVALTSAYDFAKGTVAMAESYAALHAVPTPAQALLAIQQYLLERVVSSTTETVKKVDGSTTALTSTLNDATTPTSKTRAT